MIVRVFDESSWSPRTNRSFVLVESPSGILLLLLLLLLPHPPSILLVSGEPSRFSFQKGKEFNLDIKKVKTSFGYSGGIKGDDNWEDSEGSKEATCNQTNGEIKKFLSDWKHCVPSEKRSIFDTQSNQHALGMPTFVLDDKQVTLYDIYQAVKEHGGSSKLHSWRIVADQLLSQKSSHSTGEGRSGTIASLGFCTAVRKIFFESGLDKLEMYEKLRSGKEVGSPRRGTLDKAKKGRSTEATARQEGDAMQIDDKVDPRTLQPSGAESQDSFTIFENGVLKEISKVGLVVKDGLLHHEELASRNLSVSFADQQKFQKWNVDAQTKKKWREKYQEFLNKHSPQGLRVLTVKVQDKEIELFDLYHVIRKSGGLEAVVRQRIWHEVCKLLGLKPDYQIFAELRKLYLRHLYAFEIHDIHGIEIGDVREELFSAPLPRKMAKGISEARKRVEEGHSLLARVGEETQGRAGLSGFANASSKPFLDRCKGSSDPDNPIARGKRICRALESGLQDELLWALGVLSLNSWEAANGCEPHVELSEGICCALARFLYRLARQPELLAVACNRWGEVESCEDYTYKALNILRNFSFVPPLAFIAAKCTQYWDALASCLSAFKQFDIQMMVLQIIEKTAFAIRELQHGTMSIMIPRDLFLELNKLVLSDPTFPIKITLLRVLSSLAVIEDAGHMLADFTCQGLPEMVTSMLVSTKGPEKDAAYNFIARLKDAPASFKERMADEALVDVLLQCILEDSETFSFQARAAESLCAILSPNCRRLSECILRYQEELVTFMIGNSKTTTVPFMSDVSKILGYLNNCQVSQANEYPELH
ncbi:hypothetical protein GUITHDRAFT_113678 [Guillardia theta CCMP2712]|uniref:ARID domain-containing protein n=1 Tax=Guillardia theta (strain CCMP2712) TaxID=905079 RepID=L1IVB8_GUITC|nr:hypothetical protein GUITHDRAFT_113678 [Guillardia theta CCMP2712]EKX40198.1 hypothetical protein GUITHDRAFT_113678 [Guillardia theta CCMP2712]|eukprot:XP_005827178.1 hypothetical protein GUITHDRAFT_113678 [Guillardia theta CCMP2712]